MPVPNTSPVVPADPPTPTPSTAVSIPPTVSSRPTTSNTNNNNNNSNNNGVVASLNAWTARVPLPLLVLPIAAIVAGRAILVDRESKKRDIEMEIFAAQQRRDEAVAESNNLVVVR